MGEKKCVRGTLIFVNMIALILGLGVLSLGIWVQVKKGDYIALADSKTGLTGSLLLIIIGGATAIISLFGACGAYKRSSCLLWTFFVMLLVIVIAELAALALGLIYRDKVEDEFHKDLRKTIQEYNTDVDGVTDAWDWAQKKFKCCGVDNYTDWINATGFNPNGFHNLVPDSCCKERKEGCGNFTNIPDTVDRSKINDKGCFKELKDFIEEHLLVIGASAGAFFVFEIIVIVLTLSLLCCGGPGEKMYV